jgi:hypothetical protein
VGTIRWIALPLIASSAVAADKALDKTDLDTIVSACVDFNQYTNGGWLKKNPIPPAYSNWGVSNVLAEQNREMLHRLCAELGRRRPSRGRAAAGDSRSTSPRSIPRERTLDEHAGVRDSVRMQGGRSDGAAGG